MVIPFLANQDLTPMLTEIVLGKCHCTLDRIGVSKMQGCHLHQCKFARCVSISANLYCMLEINTLRYCTRAQLGILVAHQKSH